ncbi:anion transporter [Syntrophotalea acetylenivorans]|uniref:Anion transporter n=1 Tax=Syntrophotalea acetylenivorans TaxID=1842532 RepID=A0A1L3GKL4_9BACT|nr:DASS family sodium-coupled anion symporter [Syntrophotalea acetylenivorans]APG26469.1 anion transporter [Syntrophotalea acetylenivorans]
MEFTISQGVTAQPSGGANNGSRRQRVGLLLGPFLFCAFLLLPTPEGLAPEGQRMLAVAALMATWWMSEAIPIPATSLLPLALFPLLGIMPTAQAAAPYANQLIFLFMGGFIIALAMQRWNLHRRIAMQVVRSIGFSPGRLIFGFMLASAFLSAFVSNTVTAVMMMPIGLAIIEHVAEFGRKEGLDRTIDFAPGRFHFGINLMLGIAYAATIGGVATLIGTPPNMVLACYLHTAYGFEITFARWMLVGVPLAAVLLPMTWLWLTRWAYPLRLKRVPGGREIILDELRQLGPMQSGERWTALVFVLTALAWIGRGWLAPLLPYSAMISDATIAMGGALLLFLIPVDLRCQRFVMDWHWAVKMPWGVLVLFGGGLSLAAGFESTGLTSWIGGQVMLLQQAPLLLLVIAVTTMIIFLTELTSNTATAAMAMPLLAAVAIGLHQNPLLLLIPAALAASCAFMLPVATPPNAIVFGSGYITIPQMVRSGLGLNLLSILLITLLTYLLVVPLFHIVFNELPQWLDGVAKIPPYGVTAFF